MNCEEVPCNAKYRIVTGVAAVDSCTYANGGIRVIRGHPLGGMSSRSGSTGTDVQASRVTTMLTDVQRGSIAVSVLCGCPVDAVCVLVCLQCEQSCVLACMHVCFVFAMCV